MTSIRQIKPDTSVIKFISELQSENTRIRALLQRVIEINLAQNYEEVYIDIGLVIPDIKAELANDLHES